MENEIIPKNIIPEVTPKSLKNYLNSDKSSPSLFTYKIKNHRLSSEESRVTF